VLPFVGQDCDARSAWRKPGLIESLNKHAAINFMPGTSYPAAWSPITIRSPVTARPAKDLASTLSGHLVPIRDLLNTIGTDRQPLCSIDEGAMTVEMICATFASHRAGGAAVEIPLVSRENELAKL